MDLKDFYDSNWGISGWVERGTSGGAGAASWRIRGSKDRRGLGWSLHVFADNFPQRALLMDDFSLTY